MSEPTEAILDATGLDEPEPIASSPPAAGLARQVVEFLVVLCLSVLIFRTFAAEAYIVPTGSMAPTLLGQHREFVCPNCGFRVVLGLDEEGRGGKPICPNCGASDFDERTAIDSNGDRVLVQKFLYDVRRPRRWEVAVFHFPGDPSQAYVKRVVGLPGESIQIARGDIWINGRIARKSPREQRAMRVLVFDNNHVPRDVDRYPRWWFRAGSGPPRVPSGWRTDGTRLVHESTRASRPGLDWVAYRHWDPDRGRYAPVHDFNAYNGGDVRGENVVNDLMVEARLALGRDVERFIARIDSGVDRFQVILPVAVGGPPTVLRNGRRLALANPRSFPPSSISGASGIIEGHRALVGRPRLLEVSVMDHQLTASMDGVPLFDPIDYDTTADGPPSGDSPIAFGVRGGVVTLSDVRVYRDIYYTSALAFTPRRPFGVDQPYRLGRDEFFVLGDNSPVSNDSRFWGESPVVPGELFLGKPFLVHLPGQAVPLRVFGRSLYWVPDPREIRYIR